jgi:hypothetical protein
MPELLLSLGHVMCSPGLVGLYLRPECPHHGLHAQVCELLPWWNHAIHLHWHPGSGLPRIPTAICQGGALGTGPHGPGCRCHCVCQRYHLEGCAPGSVRQHATVSQAALTIMPASWGLGDMALGAQHCHAGASCGYGCVLRRKHQACGLVMVRGSGTPRCAGDHAAACPSMQREDGGWSRHVQWS